MKLRTKMFVIILMTWIAIVIALVIGSYTVILADYRTMENADVKDYNNRSQEAINRLMDSLNVLALDWAHWNDSYKYLNDKNSAYEKLNYNLTTFKDIKIDFIIFFDNNNNYVSGALLDKNTDSLVNIPTSFLTYINSHKMLLSHNIVKTHTTGFAKIDNTYVVLSSYPVTNSEASVKPNGTIIIGYIFSDKQLQNFAQTLQVNMQLIPIGDVMNSPSLKTVADQLKNNKKYIDIAVNDKLMYIYSYLNDFTGKPIGLLKTDLPRQTYYEGLRTIHKYIWTVSLIGLIVIILVELAMKYFIIDRLYSFKSQLNEIATSRDFTKTTFLTGDDEITDMVKNSNALLNVINSNEIQLKKLIDIQSKDLHERELNEKKLAGFNQQMSLALNEIKSSEKKLTEANQKKEAMVNELKQHEHQMILINKMNEMLQFSQNTTELYSVINLAAKELFPDLHVELSIYSKSSMQLETVGQNSANQIMKDSFEPDNCWGLRAGHIYIYDDSDTNFVCTHFKSQPPGPYLCVPLIVGNEFIGLINHTAAANKTITKNQEQLAIIFSDVIKLSLVNIKFRNQN